VDHRGQPVMGPASRRVVQGATLCAQHALEGLPVEVPDGPEGTQLASDPPPELLERSQQRRAGLCGVERRVHARPGASVARIESQELDGPVPLEGRLEGSGEHDTDAAGCVAASGDVAPCIRRNESLHGRRLRIRGLVVAARVELGDGDAASFDVHEGMDERREPQPEPPTLVGHAQGDDDGFDSPPSCMLAFALVFSALGCGRGEYMDPNVGEVLAQARTGVTAPQPTDDRAEVRAQTDATLAMLDARMRDLHARLDATEGPARGDLDQLLGELERLRASLEAEVDSIATTDDTAWPDLRNDIIRDMDTIRGALDRGAVSPESGLSPR
jgi:hypothetical protein